MNFDLYRDHPPGDPALVDKIVCQLKSQGIFDQFRKECISDVDTKPAYQNLRQRVDGSVAHFLATQVWKPDLNKNQLRESLRKHVQSGGFLEVGVERIVDQVVNPKIGQVFLPQVKDVVYECLGIKKPRFQQPQGAQHPPHFTARRPPIVEASNSTNEKIDFPFCPSRPPPVIIHKEKEVPKTVNKEENSEKNIATAAPLNAGEDVNQSDNSFDSMVSGMTELASHSSLNISKESAESEDNKDVSASNGMADESVGIKTEDSFTNSLDSSELQKSDVNTSISKVDSSKLMEVDESSKHNDTIESDRDHYDYCNKNSEIKTEIKIEGNGSDYSKHDSDDCYSTSNEETASSDQFKEKLTDSDRLFERKDETDKTQYSICKTIEQRLSSLESPETSLKDEDIDQNTENKGDSNKRISERMSDDDNKLYKSSEDERERKDSKNDGRSHSRSKDRTYSKKDHHSSGHRYHSHSKDSSRDHHRHNSSKEQNSKEFSRENSRDSKDGSSSDKKYEKSKPTDKTKDKKSGSKSQDESDKESSRDKEKCHKESNRDKERKKDGSDSKHKEERARYHSESKSKSRSDSDSRDKHNHHRQLHSHSKDDKRDKERQRDDSKENGRSRDDSRDSKNTENSDKKKDDAHKSKSKEEKSDHHKDSRHHDSHSKSREKSQSSHDHVRIDKHKLESIKDEKKSSNRSHRHERSKTDSRHESDDCKKHRIEKTDEETDKKRDSSKRKRSREQCKESSRHEDRRSADRDSNGSGESRSMSGSSHHSVTSRHVSNKQKESSGSRNDSDNSASDSTIVPTDAVIVDEKTVETSKKISSSDVSNNKIRNDCTNNDSYQNKNELNLFDSPEVKLNNSLLSDVDSSLSETSIIENITPNTDIKENEINKLNSSLTSRFRKPKIASNVFEIKKIILARKNMKKLESERLKIYNSLNPHLADGFSYFKQNDIQSAREKFENFKGILQVLEESASCLEDVDFSTSDSVNSESSIAVLQKVKVGDYNSLEIDAGIRVKPCTKVNENEKDVHRTDYEKLSTEEKSQSGGLNLTDQKRSPVKLRISVRNPNDIIETEEILIFNQSNNDGDSENSNLSSESVNKSIASERVEGLIKSDFPSSRDYTIDEKNTTGCSRERNKISYTSSRIESPDKELTKRSRREKKKSRHLKTDLCISSDKIMLDEEVYKNCGAMSNSKNNNDDSFSSQRKMNILYKTKQFKPLLHKIDFTQCNAAKAVSPKSTANNAISVSKYPEDCLDDAVIPSDGDMDHCCMAGRSVESFAVSAGRSDKDKDRISNQSLNIVSPTQCNNNLSDTSDNADADEGLLNDGDNCLTNSLIGEALKDLMQESGLIGVSSNSPVKSSNVSEPILDKQVTKKRQNNKAKVQQENNQLKSARRNQLLPPKQSQRYENSDLYKPRLGFRQNSKRKRYSDDSYSESGDVNKNKVLYSSSSTGPPLKRSR